MDSFRSDFEPRPFVIARRETWEQYDPELRKQVRLYDPMRAEDAPFCLAMNRANRIAYDGASDVALVGTALGMPLWVMLDCCALPGGIVGFSLPREQVPEALADAMDPDGECEELGVTEYIAVPSAIPGEVVGVSLFSFLEGGSWGTRTKALALALQGARVQVGIAQYTNPSLRLHLRFGPMELVGPQVRVHSRPDETFVYRSHLPGAETLSQMARGESASETRSVSATHSFDPRDQASIDAFVALVKERPDSRWLLVETGQSEQGRLVQVDFEERT